MNTLEIGIANVFVRLFFGAFPFIIVTVDRHERGREMVDDTRQRAAGRIRTPAAAGLVRMLLLGELEDAPHCGVSFKRTKVMFTFSVTHHASS